MKNTGCVSRCLLYFVSSAPKRTLLRLLPGLLQNILIKFPVSFCSIMKRVCYMETYIPSLLASRRPPLTPTHLGLHGCSAFSCHAFTHFLPSALFHLPTPGFQAAESGLTNSWKASLFSPTTPTQLAPSLVPSLFSFNGILSIWS